LPATSSAVTSAGRFTYSFSHWKETFIFASEELVQEAHVVLIEETQIVDIVEEHGHPFDAHAEGKARILPGRITHLLENRGIHHAGTQGLDAAALLAPLAALAAAEYTRAIHLHAGLRERQVGAPETDLRLRPELCLRQKPESAF